MTEPKNELLKRQLENELKDMLGRVPAGEELERKLTASQRAIAWQHRKWRKYGARGIVITQHLNDTDPE